MLMVFGAWLHRSFPATLVLLFAGCATLQPEVYPQPQGLPVNLPEIHRQRMLDLAGIHQFNLKGRIGVQAKGKGFSGVAQWQHESVSDQGVSDEIALFSPLGSQLATIITTVDGVQLVTSDNKTYSAADAETLTQQVLGWKFPVSGLVDWVLGHPAKGAVELMQWDSVGRIAKFNQNGWEIEYAQYMEIDGYQLPEKINLHSPELTLKLLIKDWNVLPRIDRSQANTNKVKQDNSGQERQP
jgi:outer membrane lipoprotein LolB